MDFGYLGWKLLFVLGAFLVTESILLFSFEPIWQPPYAEKQEVLYKGRRYKLPELPPHKLVPTDCDWMQEILVEDRRYMSWVNRFRRMKSRLKKER